MDAKKKKNIRFWVIVAVVGFSIWLYEEVIEEYVIPDMFPTKWGCVEPNSIYRSGQLSDALVEKTLKKNGIQVIVALNGPSPGDPWKMAEEEAAEKLGIEFKRFELKGNGTGDIEHYAKTIEAIVQAKQQNKRILVHCSAGELRSGGTLGCYRLLVKGDDPKGVVKEMLRYGYEPRRDTDLVPFINENMGKLAGLLVEMGVIPEIPDPLPVLPADL
jgi:protein tyrosine/serine phosphatase